MTVVMPIVLDTSATSMAEFERAIVRDEAPLAAPVQAVATDARIAWQEAPGVFRIARTRLDLRPYYLGAARARAVGVFTSLAAVTAVGLAMDLPQVWAFSLAPTLAALVAVLVVQFDYLTSGPDARPRMVGRRATGTTS